MFSFCTSSSSSPSSSSSIIIIPSFAVSSSLISLISLTVFILSILLLSSSSMFLFNRNNNNNNHHHHLLSFVLAQTPSFQISSCDSGGGTTTMVRKNQIYAGPVVIESSVSNCHIILEDVRAELGIVFEDLDNVNITIKNVKCGTYQNELIADCILFRSLTNVSFIDIQNVERVNAAAVRVGQTRTAADGMATMGFSVLTFDSDILLSGGNNNNDNNENGIFISGVAMSGYSENRNLEMDVVFCAVRFNGSIIVDNTSNINNNEPFTSSTSLKIENISLSNLDFYVNDLISMEGVSMLSASQFSSIEFSDIVVRDIIRAEASRSEGPRIRAVSILGDIEGVRRPNNNNNNNNNQQDQNSINNNNAKISFDNIRVENLTHVEAANVNSVEIRGVSIASSIRNFDEFTVSNIIFSNFVKVEANSQHLSVTGFASSGDIIGPENSGTALLPSSSSSPLRDIYRSSSLSFTDFSFTDMNLKAIDSTTTDKFARLQMIGLGKRVTQYTTVSCENLFFGVEVFANNTIVNEMRSAEFNCIHLPTEEFSGPAAIPLSFAEDRQIPISSFLVRNISIQDLVTLAGTNPGVFSVLRNSRVVIVLSESSGCRGFQNFLVEDIFVQNYNSVAKYSVGAGEGSSQMFIVRFEGTSQEDDAIVGGRKLIGFENSLFTWQSPGQLFRISNILLTSISMQCDRNHAKIDSVRISVPPTNFRIAKFSDLHLRDIALRANGGPVGPSVASMCIVNLEQGFIGVNYDNPWYTSSTSFTVSDISLTASSTPKDLHEGDTSDDQLSNNLLISNDFTSVLNVFCQSINPNPPGHGGVRSFHDFIFQNFLVDATTVHNRKDAAAVAGSTVKLIDFEKSRFSFAFDHQAPPSTVLPSNPLTSPSLVVRNISITNSRVTSNGKGTSLKLWESGYIYLIENFVFEDFAVKNIRVRQANPRNSVQYTMMFHFWQLVSGTTREQSSFSFTNFACSNLSVNVYGGPVEFNVLRFQNVYPIASFNTISFENLQLLDSKFHSVSEGVGVSLVRVFNTASFTGFNTLLSFDSMEVRNISLSNEKEDKPIEVALLDVVGVECPQIQLRRFSQDGVYVDPAGTFLQSNFLVRDKVGGKSGQNSALIAEDFSITNTQTANFVQYMNNNFTRNEFHGVQISNVLHELDNENFFVFNRIHFFKFTISNVNIVYTALNKTAARNAEVKIVNFPMGASMQPESIKPSLLIAAGSTTEILFRDWTISDIFFSVPLPSSMQRQPVGDTSTSLNNAIQIGHVFQRSTSSGLLRWVTIEFSNFELSNITVDVNNNKTEESLYESALTSTEVNCVALKASLQGVTVAAGDIIDVREDSDVASTLKISQFYSSNIFISTGTHPAISAHSFVSDNRIMNFFTFTFDDFLMDNITIINLNNESAVMVPNADVNEHAILFNVLFNGKDEDRFWGGVSTQIIRSQERGAEFSYSNFRMRNIILSRACNDASSAPTSLIANLYLPPFTKLSVLSIDSFLIDNVVYNSNNNNTAAESSSSSSSALEHHFVSVLNVVSSPLSTLTGADFSFTPSSPMYSSFNEGNEILLAQPTFAVSSLRVQNVDIKTSNGGSVHNILLLQDSLDKWRTVTFSDLVVKDIHIERLLPPVNVADAGKDNGFVQLQLATVLDPLESIDSFQVQNLVTENVTILSSRGGAVTAAVNIQVNVTVSLGTLTEDPIFSIYNVSTSHCHIEGFSQIIVGNSLLKAVQNYNRYLISDLSLKRITAAVNQTQSSSSSSCQFVFVNLRVEGGIMNGASYDYTRGANNANYVSRASISKLIVDDVKLTGDYESSSHLLSCDLGVNNVHQMARVFSFSYFEVNDLSIENAHFAVADKQTQLSNFYAFSSAAQVQGPLQTQTTSTPKLPVAGTLFHVANFKINNVSLFTNETTGTPPFVANYYHYTIRSYARITFENFEMHLVNFTNVNSDNPETVIANIHCRVGISFDGVFDASSQRFPSPLRMSNMVISNSFVSNIAHSVIVRNVIFSGGIVKFTSLSLENFVIGDVTSIAATTVASASASASSPGDRRVSLENLYCRRAITGSKEDNGTEFASSFTARNFLIQNIAASNENSMNFRNIRFLGVFSGFSMIRFEAFEISQLSLSQIKFGHFQTTNLEFQEMIEGVDNTPKTLPYKDTPGYAIDFHELKIEDIRTSSENCHDSGAQIRNIIFFTTVKGFQTFRIKQLLINDIHLNYSSAFDHRDSSSNPSTVNESEDYFIQSVVQLSDAGGGSVAIRGACTHPTASVSPLPCVFEMSSVAVSNIFTNSNNYINNNNNLNPTIRSAVKIFTGEFNDIRNFHHVLFDQLTVKNIPNFASLNETVAVRCLLMKSIYEGLTSTGLIRSMILTTAGDNRVFPSFLTFSNFEISNVHIASSFLQYTEDDYVAQPDFIAGNQFAIEGVRFDATWSGQIVNFDYLRFENIKIRSVSMIHDESDEYNVNSGPTFAPRPYIGCVFSAGGTSITGTRSFSSSVTLYNLLIDGFSVSITSSTSSSSSSAPQLQPAIINVAAFSIVEYIISFQHVRIESLLLTNGKFSASSTTTTTTNNANNNINDTNKIHLVMRCFLCGKDFYGTSGGQVVDPSSSNLFFPDSISQPTPTEDSTDIQLDEILSAVVVTNLKQQNIHVASITSIEMKLFTISNEIDVIANFDLLVMSDFTLSNIFVRDADAFLSRLKSVSIVALDLSTVPEIIGLERSVGSTSYANITHFMNTYSAPTFTTPNNINYREFPSFGIRNLFRYLGSTMLLKTFEMSFVEIILTSTSSSQLESTELVLIKSSPDMYNFQTITASNLVIKHVAATNSNSTTVSNFVAKTTFSGLDETTAKFQGDFSAIRSILYFKKIHQNNITIASSSSASVKALYFGGQTPMSTLFASVMFDDLNVMNCRIHAEGMMNASAILAVDLEKDENKRCSIRGTQYFNITNILVHSNEINGSCSSSTSSASSIESHSVIIIGGVRMMITNVGGFEHTVLKNIYVQDITLFVNDDAASTSSPTKNLITILGLQLSDSTADYTSTISHLLISDIELSSLKIASSSSTSSVFSPLLQIIPLSIRFMKIPRMHSFVANNILLFDVVSSPSSSLSSIFDSIEIFNELPASLGTPNDELAILPFMKFSNIRCSRIFSLQTNNQLSIDALKFTTHDKALDSIISRFHNILFEKIVVQDVTGIVSQQAVEINGVLFESTSMTASVFSTSSSSFTVRDCSISNIDAASVVGDATVELVSSISVSEPLVVDSFSSVTFSALELHDISLTIPAAQRKRTVVGVSGFIFSSSSVRSTVSINRFRLQEATQQKVPRNSFIGWETVVPSLPSSPATTQAPPSSSFKTSYNFSNNELRLSETNSSCVSSACGLVQLDQGARVSGDWLFESNEMISSSSVLTSSSSSSASVSLLIALSESFSNSEQAEFTFEDNALVSLSSSGSTSTTNRILYSFSNDLSQTIFHLKCNRWPRSSQSTFVNDFGDAAATNSFVNLLCPLTNTTSRSLSSTKDATPSKTLVFPTNTSSKSVSHSNPSESASFPTPSHTIVIPPPRLAKQFLSDAAKAGGIALTALSGGANGMNTRKNIAVVSLADCGKEEITDEDIPEVEPDANPLFIKFGSSRFASYRGAIVGSIAFIALWFAIMCGFAFARMKVEKCTWKRAIRKAGIPGTLCIPGFSLLPVAVNCGASIAKRYYREEKMDMFMIVFAFAVGGVIPVLILMWVVREVRAHEVLKPSRTDEGSDTEDELARYDNLGNGKKTKTKPKKKKKKKEEAVKLFDTGEAVPLWKQKFDWLTEPKRDYKRSKFLDAYGPIFDGFTTPGFILASYVLVVAAEAVEGTTSLCAKGDAACCKSGLNSMMAITVLDMLSVILFSFMTRSFVFLVRIDAICMSISCVINLVNSVLILLQFNSGQDNIDAIITLTSAAFIISMIGSGLAILNELIGGYWEIKSAIQKGKDARMDGPSTEELFGSLLKSKNNNHQHLGGGEEQDNNQEMTLMIRSGSKRKSDKKNNYHDKNKNKNSSGTDEEDLKKKNKKKTSKKDDRAKNDSAKKQDKDNTKGKEESHHQHHHHHHRDRNHQKLRKEDEKTEKKLKDSNRPSPPPLARDNSDLNLLSPPPSRNRRNTSKDERSKVVAKDAEVIKNDKNPKRHSSSSKDKSRKETTKQNTKEKYAHHHRSVEL